jgi:hypothetical protein
MQQLTFYSKRFGEQKTIVDKEDFDRLKKLKNLKWCVVKKRDHIYFQKRLRGKRLIELHRWIMGEPEGKVVDHINQDTLDNRKCNLRVCSNAANLRNGRLRPNNKSGFTGVFEYKGKWGARIRVNYRNINLGYRETINEAVKLREEAQRKYWST